MIIVGAILLGMGIGSVTVVVLLSTKGRNYLHINPRHHKPKNKKGEGFKHL